jgi:phage gp29-like protein
MANKKNNNIQILNYSLAQVDRSAKGINEWRNALKAAENTSNPRRKALLDLYDDIILDSHLSAVMEKRKLNVLNSEIKFFDHSGKENDNITNIINMPFFRQMCCDILDKIAFGFSLIYFDSLNTQSVGYNLIPRKNVLPERSLVIKEPFDDKGIYFAEPPYSNYIIFAGYPNDLGLLIKAAPYAIFKKNAMQDWSTYAEIFGFPFRKATYAGGDIETANLLNKIMENTSRATHVVVPEGSNIEFVEAKGSGSSGADVFKQLSTFCDEQISKLFLGNTMTTDAQGGNYKGEVHQNSELSIAEADKLYLLSVLNNDFIKILENFGFKASGGYFNFVLEKNNAALSQRFAIDIQLANIISIDDDYFYETYGIPKPSNNKPSKSIDEHNQSSKKNQNKPKNYFSNQHSFFKTLRNFFDIAPHRRG